MIEDNGYAEATPSSYSVAGDQLDRAKGFGLFARRADGLDFFAVYDAAQEVISHAREGKGPALLHLKTNRFFGHFEGDAGTYRGADEVVKLRAEKDCLVGFRRRVIEAGLLGADQMNAVDAEADTLVDGAVKGGEIRRDADGVRSPHRRLRVLLREAERWPANPSVRRLMKH